MPAEGRIGEEYAGKEAAKGNFIPLLAMIGLTIVIMLAKRHYLKKIAIDYNGESPAPPGSFIPRKDQYGVPIAEPQVGLYETFYNPYSDF